MININLNNEYFVYILGLLWADITPEYHVVKLLKKLIDLDQLYILF